MTIRKIYMIGALAVSLSAATVSCTKNFGDINTNPSVAPQPEIGFLLTYAEDQLMKYQYNEWIWESMEQLLRFTQHVTTDPYELTSNVNSRYNVYYQQVLPSLVEIRNQIAAKPDSANYAKMSAVTYVLQIMHGIKVTDMNGSIPYTEAAKGRTERIFNPVYNTQQQLFDTWLVELDRAIQTLSENSSTQVSYNSADVYYKSDWTKWVMLANSLKLRIAARLELQDNAKTKLIFQEVMQDAIGPIVSTSSQLEYTNEDYYPFGSGGEITYRSQRFATTSIVNFMKKVNDPRLPIYFEPNSLQGNFRDTLTKYNTTLPSFINLNDPLIQFQGGPADFTTNPSMAAFLKNPFTVGNSSSGNSVSNYFLISPVNRLFFSPRYNDNKRTAFYKEVAVSAAEIDLTIAEFIQKGYAGSVDTRGSAADWYNKGVTASILTMNAIAVVAVSTTGFSGSGTDEVNTYLADPNVKLGAANDLERIYAQEHLNFFRNPNEAFVFARRTGYPKKTSTYYPREAMNETIPRRFWTIDPGETNRQNWQAAMTDQGFTPNAQDLPSLSTQRVWYDKTAPDFGEGN